METLPATLREATARLLDAHTPYPEVQAAVGALRDVFAAGSGFGNAVPLGTDLHLDSGIALGTDGAAACLFDYARTRQFLRGVAAGLRQLRERFPGETLQVVYAGTGPYAPLVLPLSTVFDPDEVQFTLLDVNPVATASVARLGEALGARRHIRDVRTCDATTYRHPVPLHLFVSETMRRALTDEPQVSIAANLAAQLVDGGLMVPHAITVSATVVEGPPASRAAHQRASTHLWTPAAGAPAPVELGEVFRLDRAAAPRFAGQGGSVTATLAVPSLPFERGVPVLQTAIETFPGIEIGANWSGLTRPYVVGDAPSFAPGDGLRFTYRFGPSPGWEVAVVNLQKRGAE